MSSVIAVGIHSLGNVPDQQLAFAVIVSMYQDKLVLVQHEERDTWEIPGGRREPGESIEQTAHRELYEESGAVHYSMQAICDYSVTRDVLSYGRVYYAEITAFESLPQSEISRMELFKELPGNLTYPDIQPALLERVRQVVGGGVNEGDIL